MCHFQEKTAVVDVKLGLNFIECEENSEGEVSLIARPQHAAFASAWPALTQVLLRDAVKRAQRHLKSAIEVLRTNLCLGRYLSIVQEALNSVGILWASRGDQKV